MSKTPAESKPTQSTTALKLRAIPEFEKKVRCFDAKELLRDALSYMREHEFSQIVVRARGKLALVSSEGIVQWLMDLVVEKQYSLRSHRVGEVIPFEKTDTFKTFGPKAPVSEVRDSFRVEPGRPKLAAVIITDDGTSRGKPIGFVDPWDMLLSYSDDFRQVKWRGNSFRFSQRQADAVRFLYEAWENGDTELHDKTICIKLGTPSSRLRHTFRKSRAWNKFIVPGSRPGTRRLDL